MNQKTLQSITLISKNHFNKSLDEKNKHFGRQSKSSKDFDGEAMTAHNLKFKKECPIRSPFATRSWFSQ